MPLIVRVSQAPSSEAILEMRASQVWALVDSRPVRADEKLSICREGQYRELFDGSSSSADL